MTTNQQLKAHCEDVIANPQDHPDWVVDMARVALASLEAEPEELPSPFDAFSSNTDWQKGFIEGQKHCRDELEELGPLYTAPPVPELKPIECPAFDGYVPHIARELQGAFKNAVIRAGYEVK